jgi:hypothetical protein
LLVSDRLWGEQKKTEENEKSINNMKTASIFTVLTGCLLAASSVQAALNLVQDGNFSSVETGTITSGSMPWLNPIGGANVVINSSNPLPGNSDNAALTSTGGNAYLFQAITLTPNIGYTINFWIADPGANGGTLVVDLNGASVATVFVSGGAAYGSTPFNFTATPVNMTGDLEFIWFTSASPATVDIGQVSVAVPEPTTMVAGALMLLPFAASTLWRCKKVSA